MNSPTAFSDSPSQKPYFLGVDVGGTNIKIGLVDDHGKTIAFESVATANPAGAGAAVERVAQVCQDLARRAGVAWSDVARAGLGTPGPMSLPEGKLLNPSNLPDWHEFPAQHVLAKALSKPVSFINDANAAALGEAWLGAGAGHPSLAFFTLGTGVGGGLISEGQLINGSNSFGSEVGHIVVDCCPDARLCTWGGGRGQLEAYASASAVAAQAQRGVASGVETCLGKLKSAESKASNGDSSATLTAKDVYEAALEGDAFALKLVDEAAFYLGVGVTCAVHMIDPGLVLLGGAMDFGGRACPIGRRFLQGVIDEFERRTFPNVFAGTKIDFAELGSDAGYLGAAAIARQDYRMSLSASGEKTPKSLAR